MPIGRLRSLWFLSVVGAGVLLAGCAAEHQPPAPKPRSEAQKPSAPEGAKPPAGPPRLSAEPPRLMAQDPAAPEAAKPPAEPLPPPGPSAPQTSDRMPLAARSEPFGAEPFPLAARPDEAEPPPAAAAEPSEPESPEAAPCISGGSAPSAESGPEDCAVVKVFYATDRNALPDAGSESPPYMAWLLRTLFATGIALILMSLSTCFYPTRLTHNLAACSLLVTAVLGILTVRAVLREQWAPAPSQAITVRYGNERGGLEYGSCEVSIPKRHVAGRLERPSIFRLEFGQDPLRHVVLVGVQAEKADEFFGGLKAGVARSAEKSALVFVHGFNLSFEDAARRTAQIAYDLEFGGAPIFYSWPSRGGLLRYAVDETNVGWTVPHLKQFLTDVAQQSGARQIHLIAHSMGSRALTAALRDLALEMRQAHPLFREVILTAPDIDAEVFKYDIAPHIVKTADRVTLYASSNDEALALSKTVHGYPRAGDSGDELVVVPGVDTIDVSGIDTSLIGHSYYGNNGTVLADLFDLVHQSKPPEQRRWLVPQYLGALKYWIFQRR